jgi:PncC family amidohydrolase
MTLASKTAILSKKFSQKKSTLACAESCTGGLIAVSITKIPGVSVFFNGSIVSYANQAKRDVLRVPESLLKKHGAVSKTVAIQMARGAKRVLKSDWAVAVTGIAGPTGGSEEKPVGLTFVAVVGPKVEIVEKRVFKGSRNEIQRKAAETAVGLLLKYLK